MYSEVTPYIMQHSMEIKVLWMKKHSFTHKKLDVSLMVQRHGMEDREALFG